MSLKTVTNFIKSILGSAIGFVVCSIVGLIFLGLAIRLALSFPGDSLFPLTFVGIVLILIFAASVFNSIRDE